MTFLNSEKFPAIISLSFFQPPPLHSLLEFIFDLDLKL